MEKSKAMVREWLRVVICLRCGGGKVVVVNEALLQ
jgi:hypothetical protein